MQLMSTYAHPSSYRLIISDYFRAVKEGDDGRLRKAGVGIDVYYDGRNGHARDWTDENAREFVRLRYVVREGGSSLNIFRLLKDGVGRHDWPHDDFWWRIFEEFVSGEPI
jgi:hypothetical protein